MTQILVPTDFSKCAQNAMTYAFEMARRSGASVHLLHIVYPTEGVDNSVYQAVWVDTYIAEREQKLKEIAADYLASEPYSKINVKTAVSVGFPASNTTEYAQENNIDLIVMGTTGATGLSGALWGSTTSVLASKTQIPVLAVPEKSIMRVGGKFAFTTDFNFNPSATMMNALRSFIHVHLSSLDVVHVLQNADDRPNKAFEGDLSAKLGDIPHQFHYLHDNDVTQAINNFVESTEAIGLVATGHKHGLLERILYRSTSGALVQHANLPVLVLHDEIKK